MMKTRFSLLFTVVLLFNFLLATVPANAALKAVGPVDPVTTIPTYYQDLSALPLQPCLDQNGMCLLPGPTPPPPAAPVTPNFDPALGAFAPITTTGPINDGNFPGEGFYYSAAAIMPIEAGELANLAFVLEYAFLSGVSPDTAIVFLRTDLQKMINLTPNSTYRVTHPYGTFDFTTDAAGNARGGGGVVIRQEDPAGGAGAAVGYLTPDMKAAVNTNIGPFLTPADGILLTRLVGTETHTYIGDAATAVPVTGGPNGNIFKIDRIVTGGVPKSAQASWQTNLWVLMGRVFTGTVASPMTIDRATYARDANGGQVDIHVTAEVGATLTLSGTGITTGDMSPDTPATGQFFSHLTYTGATLPSGLSITNSLDTPTPIAHPFVLEDEVNVTQASFDPVSRNLTVKAASRDKAAPLPVLSVPQLPAPNTLDATGTLVKAIAANTIPPKDVVVHSSHGGLATLPVSVVVPVAGPTAVNDSTSTTTNIAVVVNLTGNDTATAPASIDVTTLAIVTLPANGTVAPHADGTVTYTPNAGYTGSDSFTYTVKDSTGAVSNVATVSLTINAPVAATGVTASATPNATQAINTPVVITATGTGGNGNYEYRFYVNDGGTFYLLQPYSTSNTCTWVPGKAGAFDFFVEVRAAGTNVLRDAFTSVFAYVVTSPAATHVYLSSSQLSPQPANTPITFTAQGVGGTGTYEYRFWLNSGAGFVIAQDYSTANTWVWTPTTAGGYDMFVEVRMVGSTSIRDAFNEMVSYQIQ